MSEPVTVTRSIADDVDDYGNPTFTVSTFVVQCLVGFGPSSEPALADANPVSSQMTLYMPPETVIEDGDIFTIRGDDWVKDGMPRLWVSGLDVAQGLVLSVRRHDG
jgi:hypothetical protein